MVAVIREGVPGEDSEFEFLEKIENIKEIVFWLLITKDFC